jgi:hypothetical protein
LARVRAWPPWKRGLVAALLAVVLVLGVVHELRVSKAKGLADLACNEAQQGITELAKQHLQEALALDRRYNDLTGIVLAALEPMAPGTAEAGSLRDIMVQECTRLRDSNSFFPYTPKIVGG